MIYHTLEDDVVAGILNITNARDAFLAAPEEVSVASEAITTRRGLAVLVLVKVTAFTELPAMGDVMLVFH